MIQPLPKPAGIPPHYESSTGVKDADRVVITRHPSIKTISNKDGSIQSVSFEDNSIKILRQVGDKVTTTTTTTVIDGSEKLTKAVDEAVSRALADNNFSQEEAKQFNNLRAYVTNHCADGKFDANEIGAAIQRANSIAPAKTR